MDQLAATAGAELAVGERLCARRKWFLMAQGNGCSLVLQLEWRTTNVWY